MPETATEPPRLLFLHIPKTAGTSMRAYLARHYPAGQVLPATTWNEVVAADFDLGAYRLYSGHFRSNFRSAVPPGTKMLTVLRDPVRRYISHVRHARRDPGFDSIHESLRDLSMAEIIRAPAFATRWSNIQTRWLSTRADVAAVTALLRADPGADPTLVEPPDSLARRLDLAKACIDALDFIGFVEDIDLLLDDFRVVMGFGSTERFPVLNTADPDPATDVLTADDLAVIRAINSADLALWAYAREVARRAPCRSF